MSHVHPIAILSSPLGTLSAILEISWRLPLRVLRALTNKIRPSSKDRATTSVWLSIASSIFAPLLAHNWHLLLARPRLVNPKEGLPFPAQVTDPSQTHDEDTENGFHGFLYVSHDSKAFGTQTLHGADAVWLHAHGGGFYAGEARQYHHAYMRWVDKAYREFGIDLRIIAVDYPLSTQKPYPGGMNAMYAAFKYCLASGVSASQMIIVGDSAGGNLALSTTYLIIEDHPKYDYPAGLIMLSPWLDLTRGTSGSSPNQPTDWLTTFDSEGTFTECIEIYCGDKVKTASDPRVSPLWRKPSSLLPQTFLSAGKAEVLFADSKLYAERIRENLGEGRIETDFAEGQIHTFAIGGWLADKGVVEVSDRKILGFVRRVIGA